MRVLFVLAATLACANAQYGYTYNPYNTPSNSFYYGMNDAGYFGTPFGYGSPYGPAPYPMQTYQSPAYGSPAYGAPSQSAAVPQQQAQQQTQPTAPWPAATAGSFTLVTPSTTCVTGRTCTTTDNVYRAVDGSCNNVNNPTWGQAGMPYRRFTSPKTTVNCSNPSIQLPNPRAVSTVTVARGDTDTNPVLSLVMMVFSQFMDHDIELTPPRVSGGSLPDCCNSANAANPNCCTIWAPTNDPFYTAPGRSACMPFIRSTVTGQSAKTCTLGSDVMNANTAFLDLSQLYGSDATTAKAVRLMSGGQLLTSVDPRGRSFPPITSTSPPTMQFGDARGDVHPHFTVLLTAFLRNHNRLASNLAKLHPTADWTDEKIFQEAKRINVAIYQNIVYNNFLPALLGPTSKIQPSNLTFSSVYENWYDPTVDPTISMPFSTAAFRLHTYVPSQFDLRDSNFNKYSSLLLRNIYHNFLVTVSNNTYDDLTRGMAAQPLNDFNGMFSPEVTEWIFPLVKSLSSFPPSMNDFGADIVALNVQRGRDHMIQGYTAYRKLCSGIDVFSWSDLARAIPTDGLAKLAQVYGTNDPTTVDLYIGGVLEAPVAGSDLGPTFFCLVQDQFQRLRSGDRFYYANTNVFTPAQLQAIRSVTLSRVFCDNSDNTMAMALPRDMFRLPSQATNPIFACTDTNNIPSFNIAPWQ